MSKSNAKTVETFAAPEVVLSGIDDTGSWEAEKFVADQEAAQKAEQQPELMPKQTQEVINIVSSSATKSDKIRQLIALGEKRGTVAKLLGIRYQHVRNVEITPIKRKA
jgi:hypothetical protein